MEQDDDDYESRSEENFEGGRKRFFLPSIERGQNSGDCRETKELRKPNVPRVLVLVMSRSKANGNTLTRQ